MKKVLFLPVLLSVLLLTNCAMRRDVSTPSSFKEVISMYPSHHLSIKSPVVVRFVDSVSTKRKEKIDPEFFTITPQADGELTWTDQNTIKFIPRSTLQSNQTYQVSVDISAIHPKIADSLKFFTFEFQTKKQNIRIGHTYLNPEGDDYFNLSGSITTEDYVDTITLRKLVTAEYMDKNVSIYWQPKSSKYYSNTHHFKIDSIPRKVDPQNIKIELNASRLGDDNKKEATIEIPALGDFKLVDVKTFQDKAQQIKLIFSDFIHQDQLIEGIIYTDKKNYTVNIHDNYALIEFKNQISGKVEVTVEKGLLNDQLYKHQHQEKRTVEFHHIHPGVRLVHSETILPYGDILPFTIETVHLKAVDVRVTKVVQKNILQFLQKNKLNGKRNMQYIGEHILTTKVNLNAKKNLSLWGKQVIDLKSMIKKDPTALYHIEVGFRKSYSTYPCNDTTGVTTDPSTLGIKNEVQITEKNFWEQHDLHSGYDWDERNNPCNSEFYKKRHSYRGNKTLATNILGSNLGVIAKEEKDGDLLVTVTSIKTTTPLANTKIEIYNLQNRLLKMGYTNDEGIAEINGINDPFLVVASYGNQRGYLKLRDSESLSLSRFDVGGYATKDDLKGLLYAERGVWRPGDSIFVNLILEDKHGNFPKGYPIGFEFTNPKGQIIERRTVTKGLNGHYPFWTKTNLDDVTGTYLVKAFVGKHTYSKTIKVETIRPNRLKINLHLGDQKTIFVDSSFLSKITTKWLHGAVGENLRHKIDVVYTKSYTSFKGYHGFKFEAPYRNFQTVKHVFLDETSDKNGVINKKTKLPAIENAPGILNANFSVKVFEKGGRFSVDKTHAKVHPYNAYVGVKSNKERAYNKNEAVKFDFVNLSKDGKLKNDTLFLTLYRLEYYWWYNINRDDYVYQGEMNKKPVKIDTVVTSGGKGSYKFILDQYSKYGRYLLLAKNTSGHTSGKVLSYYRRGYSYESTESQGTKRLDIKVDKDSYKSGEEIKLTIPTAKTGRIFVSIENGQEILEAKWIKAQEKTTTYTFKALHKHSPYVYVHVIYTQPHKHDDNDLPLRMYGVLPIKVESKNAHLYPEISMPDELKPNKAFDINIKEKNNLPMTYTLAMVDEGLLDITHYKMPEVWKNFNQKQALEVKTWDVFDRVIKAERFNTKNLLSLGGDGSAKGSPEGVKINRFKPVVKFIGPFYCAPGKSNTHHINMPNYVGSVKVMVIAGHKGTYGKASKQVKVKDALMVLGTMPRVLGPEETIKLPVDVFAMKDHIKNVSVSVETNGLFKIDDKKTKTVSFTKQGQEQVYFQLKTKQRFGLGKVKIIAKSGQETSSYEVALNVRTPNQNRVHTITHVVPSKTKYQDKLQAYGYESTNFVTAEVSSIPAINLKKRLDYLIHYPYGCVEQTTSSVFPQLHLSTLMDLKETRKREIEENIKAGIERLKRFQTWDGGFAYWPGGSESHEWGSNYAGHFLLEAESKGFYVEKDFIDNWIAYQTKKADEWSGDNYENLTQSYRLYLLAKAKQPNLGAMNRLRLRGMTNDISNWYLAGAYSLVGQTEIAEELIKDAPKTGESKYSNYYYYSFGSRLRNESIILNMLTELGRPVLAWETAKKIAEKLNTNRYMSTQTTAYCLLAIANYVKSDSKNSTMDFNLQLKGNVDISSPKSIWQKTVSFEKTIPFNFENKSKSPLFLTIIQNGIPDAKDTLNESKVLSLSVVYKDEEGDTIQPTFIKQGTDFVAEVTVTNYSKKYQPHVSFTQVFPSGWEIHNNKMSNTVTWRNQVNFEDIRDDRVNLFYNIASGETKTFKVFLNASYLGRYYLPAVQTEAMYDHEVRARKHGFWVEVVE